MENVRKRRDIKLVTKDKRRNGEDIDEDIAYDVEKRLEISNYEINRPLPIGKYKKVIGLMKDQ